MTSYMYFEAQIKYHILHLSFLPPLGLVYFTWEVDCIFDLGRWCGGLLAARQSKDSKGWGPSERWVANNI